MRQRLIWLMIVLGASFYIFSFAIGAETETGKALGLSKVQTRISTAASVLFTLAIGLGIINLFYVHGSNIAKRRAGWPFSLVVFGSFIAVFWALMWQYQINAEQRALTNRTEDAVNAFEKTFEGPQPAPLSWSLLWPAPDEPGAADEEKEPTPPAFPAGGFVENYVQAPLTAMLNATVGARLVDAAPRVGPPAANAALGTLTEDQLRLVDEWYDAKVSYQFEPRFFFVDYVQNPLAATVMALLGFYITYAAYRAFRVRSVEATLMMLSAALIILGSDAVGGWISHALIAPVAEVLGIPPGWFNLSRWAELGNGVANSGMQRGLWIGISIATIAVSLRMLLGLERGVIEVRRGGE